MPKAVDHIVLVLPTFYPEVFGGAERQAQILAEALGRRGVRVTIIAPTTTGPSSETSMPFGLIVRIALRHYPSFGGAKIASTLKWIATVTGWICEHAAEIDLVYVFHGRLHAVAALAAAAITGKPLLVKLGGSDAGFDLTVLGSKRGGYGALAAAWLKRRADGFVANSQAIVADLRGAGVPDRRIFPFPNGVVIPDIGERSGQDARFVFTGRLDREKNVQVLIEAAALCRDRGVRIELSLIGEGPDRATMEVAVDRFGVADRVTFLGRCDDVYPILSENDFFVSASVREGQSNSLLEAMAIGCIPIVANTSGVEDVVEHGVSGFICEVVSPESFASAMTIAAALSPEARHALSRSARQFVVDNLAIDTIASKTLAAAQVVMARRRAHVG